MLWEKIQEDLKTALKKGDSPVVSTLRLLIAAVHNKEIELQKIGKLTDEEIIGVIRKEAKQRRESIDAYQKAARNDLADKEDKELQILGKYLPQEINSKELEKIVRQVIAEINATGPGDFGKVMGVVMRRMKGQADGNQIAAVVKNLLSS